MFGDGAIWFDLENGKVSSINHRDDKFITEI
jgi:hypothetical protein